MSKPQFFVTAGYGETKFKNHYYSQAVRVGNRVETSGQGGWDSVDDQKYPIKLEDEIAQAFVNLTKTLKTAGASWDNVIHINSYHVDFNQDLVNSVMTDLFRQYMPHHAPIWTCLGVTKLGDPKMRVEIRATAIVDQS